MAQRLNGRWNHKENKRHHIIVDRVYKSKEYVWAYGYETLEDGRELMYAPRRIPFHELKKDYERESKQL